MANQLKMALIETLLRLHAQGWSQRRIARELGIDRSAVARHIRCAQPAAIAAGAGDPAKAIAAESKPARAPTGSSPSGAASEIGVVAVAARAGTVSVCAVWQAAIEAKL